MARQEVSVIGLLLSGSLGLLSLGYIPAALDERLPWVAFLLLLGGALGAAGMYFSIRREAPHGLFGVEAELRRLERLRQDGLLSAQEVKGHRRRILEGASDPDDRPGA